MTIAKPLFAEVLRQVSYETGVAVPVILGRRRHAAAVRARTAAIWAGNVLLDKSQVWIGRRIDRDSTTVGAAMRRARRWQDCDPAFQMLAGRLRAYVSGAAA
jgi:chromosomal replication initiation ATPase DnaA